MVPPSTLNDILERKEFWPGASIMKFIRHSGQLVVCSTLWQKHECKNREQFDVIV